MTLFNGTVPIASVSSNGTSVSDRVTVWCNGTVQIKKVACYDSGSFVLVAKSAHGVADGAVTLHVVHGRDFAVQCSVSSCNVCNREHLLQLYRLVHLPELKSLRDHG